jgi:YVTN family beta-propeller protein
MIAAHRSFQREFMLFWLGLVAWALLGGGGGCSSPPPPDPHEPVGFRTFTSPQSDPIVLSPDGAFVYVANTTSNSVSFIRTSNFVVFATVATGIEPVSLAVKPNGLELWVSNHVSDTLSVIDTDATSASYGQVIETIQSLDANGVTQLDEPVGIAFASDSKAYVALSSRNRIAVIDAANYAVTGFIQVTAQEPRAIAVRNNKLHVAAFESGNKSQLSVCVSATGGDCTLGLTELFQFAVNPNLPGEVKKIVTGGPGVPDRDVFVYSTSDETLLSTASGVGTLLYDLVVAANGTIYVSETDARNLVNGDDGLTVADLDGRMFDNEIAKLTCSGASCSTAATNLEPGNPTVTTHANSLATPYGLALSGDDTTLLVTAAGVSRLACLDTATLTPRAVLDVGAIPKGVTFDTAGGSSGTAYVLNTLGNSVSKVAVSVGTDGSGNPTCQLTLVATKNVGNDPTPLAVRQGNIAFNNAFASTTGSHSCGSCHPDGNTDQLLWRIGGACPGIGCGAGDEPRTTMPVRGLRNTLPLHWDGTLGDPFGGGNGAVGLNGTPEPGHTCDPNDADGDHDCFLDLVEGALAGVMCDHGGTCPNTGLTAQAQSDMATFLGSVAYPPARSRRLADSVSSFQDAVPASLNGVTVSGQQGFMDFFVDQGGNNQPHTCADADGGCHALPLGTATNSATLAGFDSPTMRGMTDRFLQFSLGPTNAGPILQFANGGLPAQGISPLETAIRWDPAKGFQEVTTFGAAFGVFEPTYNVRPLDLFQMFEEASTGFSGALGRQVTLNTTTAGQSGVQALLTSLESADARGVVNLRGSGLRSGAKVNLSYDAPNNRYLVASGNVTLTQAQLLSEAQNATTLATLTAHLRSGTTTSPQPLLSTAGAPSNGLIGDPPLPNPSTASDPPAFTVAGVDVSTTAVVFVNGQISSGATIACGAGSAGGFCNDGNVTVNLASSPGGGLHLLQVQNPAGLLSNELPVCFGASSGCVSD